jgi:hypothetical protein
VEIDGIQDSKFDVKAQAQEILDAGDLFFACGLGAMWIATTALAFHSGAPIVGYILGGALTLVMVLVSTIDFCIPSHIYWVIFGFPLNPELTRLNLAPSESRAVEHYKKFLTLWKDADPGITEVEDAKKRVAGLRGE